MKKIFLQTVIFLSAPFMVLAQDDPPLVPCGNTLENPCDFNALMQLGQNILNFIIAISLPLSAIAFAWAGFLYLSSGGSPEKIKQAHGIFTKVAIGLTLVLSAWLIVNMIMLALTDQGLADIFNE